MASQQLIDQLTLEKKLLTEEVNQKSLELQRVTAALNSLLGVSRINWTNGAFNCLTENDRSMSTKEILEYLLPHDKNRTKKELKNCTVGLSVALGNMCKKNIIRKIYVEGKKGFLYAIKK